MYIYLYIFADKSKSKDMLTIMDKLTKMEEERTKRHREMMNKLDKLLDKI